MPVPSEPVSLWRILVIEHFTRVVHGAMRQQRQRLMENPPRLEDGFLFSIALADLVKAARVAHRTIPHPTLQTALDEFGKAFPQAKDFRDLVEHWDDYAQGKGREQARLRLESGSHWFWWKSISPPVLRIGGETNGLDLDLDAANTAGAKLYDALRAALRSAREGTAAET